MHPMAEKSLKKRMTGKPNLKNCHGTHTAAVETYLLIAFCSLPCG